jgi:hypothetical protein
MKSSQVIAFLSLAALSGCGAFAPPRIMTSSPAEVTVESQSYSGSSVAKVATDHCAKYGKRADYLGSDHVATKFACR